MRIPKVSNMTSPRTGNTVANQYIIDLGNGEQVFQSYNSIIAWVRPCRCKQPDCPNPIITTLDEKRWNYSVTTGKYRNQFLGEGIAETRRKIEGGEYYLADLNQ